MPKTDNCSPSRQRLTVNTEFGQVDATLSRHICNLQSMGFKSTRQTIVWRLVVNWHLRHLLVEPAKRSSRSISLRCWMRSVTSYSLALSLTCTSKLPACAKEVRAARNCAAFSYQVWILVRGLSDFEVSALAEMSYYPQRLDTI